jgi:hypothetical protein
MRQSKTDTGRAVLARYTDPHGRPHRVVLRGRLVLDVAAGDLPRMVARLSDEEGEPQARALLEASAIDEGYLARARREPRPFIRALTADDLRPPSEGQGHGDPDSEARDELADDPPLAA